MSTRISLPSAASMRWASKFFFASLVLAMVWGLAASADLFAQVQTRVFLQDDIEIIEEQALATSHVTNIGAADCQAGQTVKRGESCTYPGVSVTFEVASDGSAKISGGGLNLNYGRGRTITLRNTTLLGRTYNFVAKGQSDGSWYLETVGDMTVTEEDEDEDEDEAAADCQAGQTVNPGESCTYPGASGVTFEVASDGSAKITGGGLNLNYGRGRTITLRNTTLLGRTYNFVAKGQSDGSWYLETVGDMTVTEEDEDEDEAAADCQAGQTVNPGESCTYPNTQFVFRVDASGSATFAFFRAGRGGSIINTGTINGVSVNFVAKGQSDGSWYLETVGDMTVPEEDEDEAAASSTYPEVTLIYDTDRNRDNIFLSQAEGDIMAQRYDVPAGGRLASVLVAPVYASQSTTSGIPANAPKDFTLKVWDVDQDGLPGNELYSMDVDEATDTSHLRAGLSYAFLQVDLPAENETLGKLPDRVFIGLANKGSDRNYLIFATSPRQPTAPNDAAYWYGRLSSGQILRWHAVKDMRLTDGRSLENQVFAIRPVFHIPSDSALEETIVSYDTGQDNIYLTGASEDIMANLYDVPPKSRLASVSVAPVYDNQVTNSDVPAGAPRDFTLKVWDVSNNLPGDELYSVDVEEGEYTSHVLSDDRFWFLHIDLPAEDMKLSALPDRVFIGLANKGSDSNYLNLAVARRKSDAPDNIAYLYTDIGGRLDWFFLSHITLRSGGSLSDHVFPIRARFLAKEEVVSAEDAPELPSGLSLAQNYPNPFNPATSISWTQSGAERVRLSVYNLLGQQVAAPVDGSYPAGEHEVRLDAAGWPSGVYTYVLETETRMLTRHMVLLK